MRERILNLLIFFLISCFLRFRLLNGKVKTITLICSCSSDANLIGKINVKKMNHQLFYDFFSDGNFAVKSNLAKEGSTIVSWRKEFRMERKMVSHSKLRPKTCCFFENLTVNYFTFALLDSADKFSIEQQVFVLHILNEASSNSQFSEKMSRACMKELKRRIGLLSADAKASRSFINACAPGRVTRFSDLIFSHEIW